MYSEPCQTSIIWNAKFLENGGVYKFGLAQVCKHGGVLVTHIDATLYYKQTFLISIGKFRPFTKIEFANGYELLKLHQAYTLALNN